MSRAGRIGPYRILRLIRQGGQGSVYLGYDSRLQRRVAVKLYRLPSERPARRQIVAEARLVASINSPRVVKLYDVISSTENLALIMEYVPGVDLEELLEQGHLSLSAILHLAIDISSALASARQRRIVHGDLKASNVLIDAQGRALLSDFGIARGASSKGLSQHCPGSITAISPEQYQGKVLDVRSDLFALGCLLYRLLSGKHPFVFDDELDVKRLLTEEPEPLPETLADGSLIPPGMRDLVQRLLQKDVADRPDNTHRVRQILRELLRHEPQSMRQMPLAGVKSLRRQESEGEFPPHIPRELSKRGRSQLAEWRGFAELTPASVLRYLGKPRIQAAVLALLLGSAAILYLALPKPYRIALLEPEVALAGTVTLPDGVTLDWLSERVCIVISELDKQLLFYHAPASCPEGSRGFADNLPLPAADEELQLALRCSSDLCLLGLTRQRDAEPEYRQALLLTGMPASQWAAVTAELAETIYRDRF